jgi:phosphoglucomutase
MSLSPLAGKPAPSSLLADVARLVSDYFTERPDPSEPGQRVAFGTSGHRGSSLRRSFNEAHVLAVTQAICLHRKREGIDGPLYLGRDTHALATPAFATALEVLAANGVETRIDEADGPTPTPVVSHAILGWNQGRKSGLADGILLTPSHNPPEDGGIKYNPPSGGPASSETTSWIERTANAFLADELRGVARWPLAKARAAVHVRRHDFVSAYVGDLGAVLDMGAIRAGGLRLGVDPLGGAGVGYWARIAERWGIALELVNAEVDPTFRFMSVDWDGKIRMDCSSPHAMAKLVALKDRFDVAFAQDTDNDRHGIVTRSAGLMNPNHYLAVAIDHLFARRSGWAASAAVGKTVVSSSILDRVAARRGRALVEVPVGFKWFVDGLLSGALGFGGEESAGASFLRRDGSVWTTDKDGILLSLLSAEIAATAGRDPGLLYRDLTAELGDPVYERIDAAATPAQKSALGKLTPEQVGARELAGEPVLRVLSRAPGNDAAIGGIKVEAKSGWFAARPSGTEDVYKIYAESFLGEHHLRRIQDEAREIVAKALAGA